MQPGYHNCNYQPILHTTSPRFTIQVRSEQQTNSSSWSSVRFVCGATSSGDHWLGVDLLHHEEKRRREEEPSTRQVRELNQPLLSDNHLILIHVIARKAVDVITTGGYEEEKHFIYEMTSTTQSQVHKEENYFKNLIYENTSMTQSQVHKEEKYLKNPIYEGTCVTQSQLRVPDPSGCETSPKQKSCPRATHTMYNAVNKHVPSQTAIEDEQTYDIPHRGKVNGQCLVNVHCVNYDSCVHAARVHEPLRWVGRVPMGQKSFLTYHP